MVGVNGFSTRALHDGQEPDPTTGSVAVPIYATSTYKQDGVGGLRAGMGYLGTADISELRTKTRFLQISPATVRENHPHDIAITQESPNYTAEHVPDAF